MPKIPYKGEESRDDDDDYEIVSFEDFCDKSPGSKTDLLTLNDNINYRLCYESDRASKYIENEDESGSRDIEHVETSLSGPKNISKKMAVSSFTPFGSCNAKVGKGSLFGGVIPKTRNEGESSSRDHGQYQRFSERRNVFQRIWEHMPGFGSGMLVVVLVCALCIAAWWAVCGAVGGAWGEEHYKRLWERAHPDNIKQPLVPISYETILPEHRYHDHNNLSTKNKGNITEVAKKKLEQLKKSGYTGRTAEMGSDMCSQTTVNMRFDCYPQAGSNEAECLKRGCCWRSDVPNVPYCFYPPRYDTFSFLNMTENRHGIVVYYAKRRPSGYPGDFQVARLDFKYLSNDVLNIKITDAENRRFEPPFPEIPMVPGPISELKYRVQIDSSSIGFKVIRNVDNVTILDTQDVGGLILSDKFLQVSALLPTDRLYGLGERRARLAADFNWNTFTLFNSDTPPAEGRSLYGTHPFYLAVERDGSSHGVFLLNSNAIDVALQPAPALTYRALGGVLDLFVLLGPAPRHVVAQYTALVGRPFMPPYWALGFHLCRFNYGSLNETRDVWRKNREAGIPFDVQWNDLDYMNNSNDFSYDAAKYAGLPEFVRDVHAEGMRYVVLFDPGISASEAAGRYPPYDRGIELDVFIKNSTNQPFIGKVWNKKSTVFPDFTHPNSTGYWVEMMSSFHAKVPFDGAWIDMNEPSNFVSGALVGSCAAERLPYRPHGAGPDGLRTKTLCMDARHYAGDHYHWHNLYALTEAIATHFALTEITGKRPFIISRASFAGLGHFAGHWSGDVASDWHDMRMSIPELLSFSLFGIPMMGADICGFRGDTTRELCTRWMQLGAFYPFARNHNDDTSIPQDPVSLGPEVVAASRRALRLRYRLLPYYYTLFWRAHVRGDTVARPLFFDTPELESTHGVDDQFMVGPHVMVAPLLAAGASSRRALFPGACAWYSLEDGAFLTRDQWHDIHENQTVAVKGGAILPLQQPPERGPVSTARTRAAPLQLLVACAGGGAGCGGARGDLYWDDGEGLNSYEEKKYSHIEFVLRKTQLSSVVRWWGYGVPSLDGVTVLGVPAVVAVSVNGAPCRAPCRHTYTAATQQLAISLDLPLDKPFTIEWTYKHPAYPMSMLERIASSLKSKVSEDRRRTPPSVH